MLSQRHTSQRHINKLPVTPDSYTGCHPSQGLFLTTNLNEIKLFHKILTMNPNHTIAASCGEPAGRQEFD